MYTIFSDCSHRLNVEANENHPAVEDFEQRLFVGQVSRMAEAVNQNGCTVTSAMKSTPRQRLG